MSKLQLGLEVFQERPALGAGWGRCALVSNQASVTSTLEPAYKVCHSLLKDRLRVLFGPQHGFWGTAQDNMIETNHDRLLDVDLPVYSLYSETRQPTDYMLQDVDSILIDMQLVGCRIYTFKATVFGCLQAAKRLGKKVVVFDRPNPLGGVHVEGRCNDPDMLTFVGPDILPMRHGLSTGEAAKYFNRNIGAVLEVVPMKHWDWSATYRAAGRHWVITSPNLPTLDPVFVYPGMVLFEGCNISEGRGTGLPFQFIGAPFVKKGFHHLKSRVYHYYPQLKGVYLREACFQPTSGKWQGEVCYGLQLHPLEPEKIASYSLALALMRAMADIGGFEFKWKEPPYEYEYTKTPIDVIIGSKDFRKHFEDFSLSDSFWQAGVTSYLSAVEPFLIYPRSMAPMPL